MTNNIYFIANWKMYGGTSSLNSLSKLINLFKELRDDVLPYIFQLAIKYILFVINDILIYRFVF